MHGYEIIDAHAHIYPNKIAAKAAESIAHFYNFVSYYRDGTIQSMLNAGGKHGLTGYLVCSVATNPHQVDSINTFVCQQCSEHPEFFGFGALHPQTENAAEVVQQIHGMGLCGIKLHPDFQRFNIDDPAVYPIYEAAQGRLPILVHMGDIRYDFSHPRRLKKVLEDFPQLSVIAAHLGGWQIWDESRAILRHSNVWFDTSSALQVLTAEQARVQIQTLGIEKCFFGTDYPVWNYDAEIERFFQLGFSREENQKIFAGNFKEFINPFLTHMTQPNK